jgi:indolepyruvate ferredoxin oxidoreductase
MTAIMKEGVVFSLGDRYAAEEGAVYLSGMQALLRLMLDRKRLDRREGLNTAGFVTGYPGSPVGGVDHEMLSNRALLEANDIVFRAGLNEELAATAAFGAQTLHTAPGAQYDGVFALWYGKAPGVDRALDAFTHANFRGVGRNGGVLAVAGDDPHARSTIFPSDSNGAFIKAFMPVLAPGNIQEVVDLGLHGFALSRACGLWVGFKLVTDVADSAGIAIVGKDRVRPVMPSVELDGAPLVPTLRANEAGPVLIEAERRMVYGQLELARRYAALNDLNKIMSSPNRARFGILTGGKTYFDVRQALSDMGIGDVELETFGIRILKMGMLYPVEPDIVRTFAEGLEEIIVVEDKRPLLEVAVKDILYDEPERPRVVGKNDGTGAILLPGHGELSADQIARALARRFSGKIQLPSMDRRIASLERPRPAPVALSTTRAPYFCSGCPHNRSLRVPEGSVVGAGIGCHIMALWMGPVYGDVVGFTQMGGEGAQWVGLSPFTDTRHFYQNLGDGTFAHSGSLGVRFAASSGANITYKILYNSTVAMTGGQDVLGGMSVAKMVRALEADGVKKIIVTTDQPERYPGGRVGGAEVRHRDDLIKAEQDLAAVEGVTVLINDQECATQKRRLRKRGKMAYRAKSVVINERVCEGCGDCGRKSNCLSVQPIETEFGRKTQIHQSSCNQDYSCLLGDCPSFMTVERSAASSAPAKAPPIPFPSDVALASPLRSVSSERFAACLMGVGGTGVVTVNQILGTAAFLSGLAVQTYDHTGSSQKAGPVVSHLKIAPAGTEASPTVGIGEADLYLAFDSLSAIDPVNLAMAAPEKTIAVASMTRVPTGEMVADKHKSYPMDSLISGRIDAVTKAAQNLYLDAQGLAEALTRDHMASNMLMVGAAYQAGVLPIPAEAIEQAIRLNGAAVDMNVDAFRWGRLFVANPDRVKTAAASRIGSPSPPAGAPELPASLQARIDRLGDPELAKAAALRTRELIAYQDEFYATEYLTFVETVHRAEQVRAPGRRELSIAVARGLHKVMAYKDEYEVARLLLDEAERARIETTFGKAARITWHLHPTFLRAIGVNNKIPLGPWFAPVLRLLKRLKAVRGTPFDLLGRTHIRRIERALIRQYREMVESSLGRLSGSGYPQAVRLAGLVDLVRGYEGVKLANIETYKAEVAELAKDLGVDPAFGPEFGLVPVPVRRAEMKSA